MAVEKNEENNDECIISIISREEKDSIVCEQI